MHDRCNLSFVNASDRRASERVNSRHSIVVPRPNFESYRQSFMYSAISLWNTVPENLALGSFGTLHRALGTMNF